jgi:hypothetical protein
VRKIAEAISAEVKLATLTVEQRLAGIAPAERLAGIAPAERLAGIAPAERLADVSERDLVLALPVEVLRGLSKEYIQTLPEDVQHKIRERIKS